jgi:hypothetical protein
MKKIVSGIVLGLLGTLASVLPKSVYAAEIPVTLDEKITSYELA